MLLSSLIFDPFAITNCTRETVGKTRLVYGDLGEWAAQKSPFPERCICWSCTDCFCLGNKLQKAGQTESSSAVLPGSVPALFQALSWCCAGSSACLGQPSSCSVPPGAGSRAPAGLPAQSRAPAPPGALVPDLPLHISLPAQGSGSTS